MSRFQDQYRRRHTRKLTGHRRTICARFYRHPECGILLNYRRVEWAVFLNKLGGVYKPHWRVQHDHSRPSVGRDKVSGLWLAASPKVKALLSRRGRYRAGYGGTGGKQIIDLGGSKQYQLTTFFWLTLGRWDFLSLALLEVHPLTLVGLRFTERTSRTELGAHGGMAAAADLNPAI